MASLARPEIPNNFRFEFDSANKILLARLEGIATDESVAAFYWAFGRYAIATDANASILDLSSITQVAVSTEFIRELARQEPAMPDAEHRRRIIVAPKPSTFGVARMFQLVGERKRPLLEVVHTMDEALLALGVGSPRFEALD
jgi:hypothetical protein